MPMATIPGTAWLFNMEEKELLERKVVGVANAKKRNTARKPAAAPASGVFEKWLRNEVNTLVNKSLLPISSFHKFCYAIYILGVDCKWAGEYVLGEGEAKFVVEI